MKRWLASVLYSCLGVGISTLSALLLAHLFTGTAFKLEAPLLFAVALVILASHFGAVISLPGSLLAAVVFALVLYTPEHCYSFSAVSEADRNTLAWMMLTSVAFSYLLYPTRSNRNNNNKDRP